MQLAKVTDFRLSQWLVIDGESVLGLLNCVEADNVTNISEGQSVYRVVDVYI